MSWMRSFLADLASLALEVLIQAGILLDLGLSVEDNITDLLKRDAASDKTMFVVFSRIDMHAVDEEFSQSSRILGSWAETKDS